MPMEATIGDSAFLPADGIPAPPSLSTWKPTSRGELIMYLAVRERLRTQLAKAFAERGMNRQCVGYWELESLEDMIEDAARNICATTFLREDIAPDLSESEQDETHDEATGFGLEAFLFGEQRRQHVKKLTEFFPTSTEEDVSQRRAMIPVLQSISDSASRIFATHVQSTTVLEEEQATEELDADDQLDEAEATIELEQGKRATKMDGAELEEGQEETEESGRGDVEEEVMVDKGKIKAVAGGAMESTETEETPWIDTYYKGKSVTKMEEEEFAAYRSCWEREWGNGKGNSFENLSLLSPMMFTHCTPGCSSIGAVVGRTLQVYSVKIAEIKGLRWPLKVYGVVAARDDVDKNRNPLFLRSRDDYQIVHQKDPYLQLTGPCRAIVSEEPIEIEIQLRVNRGKKTDDRPLISDVFYYNGDNAHLFGSSADIENHLCKIELSYQQLNNSVQATFLGFHVDESSPFECGVRVLCSAQSEGGTEDDTEPEHRQVLLYDSRYKIMPTGICGYLNLARQVVSVELQGELEVLIQTYAPSGGIAAHGSVFIRPQKCHTSQHACYVGGSEVKFTVVWSLLLEDKTLMLMNGYVDPFEDLPSFDPSSLEKLGISE